MIKDTLTKLEHHQEFIDRHIGSNPTQQQEMLAFIGASSLTDLTDQILPEAINFKQELEIGLPKTEVAGLAYLRQLASQNQLYKNYIGMGYYGTHVPNVILRNVFENPGWYTAYTPYQPEIAQGRLEALLNFQQLSADLTGQTLASASLLDEATAAAEAMALAKRVSKAKKANKFFVADDVFPQTLDVIKTRAECFGFELVVGPACDAVNHEIFGALLQYSNRYGNIANYQALIDQLHQQKAVVAMAADLLSLVLLKSPGSIGADVIFGSAQRFGVPMGFGGPHAAFFVTRDEYKRAIPGRIIGVSKDSRGKKALRMAMQTREQHIRREKANSNICTAQVLLANMASFYAVYHGPQGLKRIANRIHRLANIFAMGLEQKGIKLVNDSWFDTVTFIPKNKDEILQRATIAKVNLRIDTEGSLGVSFDETSTRAELVTLFDLILGDGHGLKPGLLDQQIRDTGYTGIANELERDTDFLTHPTFNSYHTETELMRYIKRLENKDLALNHSMISLGSCTMKLNAAVEMLGVSWPEFANMHPFCPQDQAKGYLQLIDELSEALIKITGYDAICMQPNSGAQGEYAGLLAIRKYHESRGESHRNICLIPQSAHGTNPASAQMAGMKVVVTSCDKQGNVDLDDLRTKAAEVADNLACIMITYPSTHGVYEETVQQICDIIHQHGGQVYLDGANMNAQVGLTSPGLIGADVSHLNLHKTFAIPHGGGGPGMGPIGVKAHLAPFVAGHTLVKINELAANNTAVSAAPYGSAGILPISWMYIYLLGSQGLKMSSQVAMLNANYIAKHLAEHYPILYRGRNDRVAHECIIDLRPLKESSGITEMDIAKRLNDYGFHAPTMSFPVAGTLMVEPTESESKLEIDRFIEAMIAIRKEIAQVESGYWPSDNNPLHNAPHTLDDILDANFDERPYSRELAVYPTDAVKQNKFWPSVNRIDDVYGDRNLTCCLSTADYQD